MTYDIVDKSTTGYISVLTMRGPQIQEYPFSKTKDEYHTIGFSHGIKVWLEGLVTSPRGTLHFSSGYTIVRPRMQVKAL